VVTWACWGLHITLKLVFWLGELPLHEIFTTENGTTVERLQNGKVRVLSPFAQGTALVAIFLCSAALLSSLSHAHAASPLILGAPHHTRANDR